jgi:diguanylate cyclase (GGDEF)-like protein/PAS domain S-box-containing protein
VNASGGGGRLGSWTVDPRRPAGVATRSRYLGLAARLSRILGAAELDTLNVAVEECLEQIGGHADVDLAFIILTDDDERVVDDWRWVRPGLDLRAPTPGSLLRETFGSVTEVLRLGHTVTVDDLEGIELAPSERALADANGLRAMLVAPVRVGSTLLGITGLSVVGSAHHWDNALVEQVNLFAELLVKAVVRIQQRGRLAAANARARRIAEFLPDSLILVDRSGLVTFASASFGRAAGARADSLDGASLAELLHPDDAGVAALIVSTSPAGGTGRVARIRVGVEWRWFALSWQLVHEPGSGVADETVITLRDVHDDYETVTSLSQQVGRDPLTGLLDRRGLDAALTQLAHDDATIVVMFIDVDRFKTINDTLGHAAGDEVLAVVASTLREAAQPRDLIARVGGDEFCVIIPIADRPGDPAASTGARITAIAADTLTSRSPPVTLSIGVSPPGLASNAARLRDAADTAMYHAKRSGGGKLHTTPPSAEPASSPPDR